MKESNKACEKSGKACEESGKALCGNISEPLSWQRIFWKNIFALLKMVCYDIVEASFKRKVPEINAKFCVFESKCPKIMVLSKVLKAKLSLIPSEVASISTPSRDRNDSRKTAAAVASPRSTTRHGDSSRTHGASLEGPSQCMCVCVSHKASSALSLSLSLSRWRKVGLPLALWQESRPNFKGLPKVSGVATNHWVFLRCDWSPISS